MRRSRMDMIETKDSVLCLGLSLSLCHGLGLRFVVIKQAQQCRILTMAKTEAKAGAET